MINKEQNIKQILKEKIEAKLITKGVIDPLTANAEQLYQATVQVLKDLMLEKRENFKNRIKVNFLLFFLCLCVFFCTFAAEIIYHS